MQLLFEVFETLFYVLICVGLFGVMYEIFRD